MTHTVRISTAALALALFACESDIDDPPGWAR
jgi:hypothetical protein